MGPASPQARTAHGRARSAARVASPDFSPVRHPGCQSSPDQSRPRFRPRNEASRRRLGQDSQSPAPQSGLRQSYSHAATLSGTDCTNRSRSQRTRARRRESLFPKSVGPHGRVVRPTVFSQPVGMHTRIGGRPAGTRDASTRRPSLEVSPRHGDRTGPYYRIAGRLTGAAWRTSGFWLARVRPRRRSIHSAWFLQQE